MPTMPHTRPLAEVILTSGTAAHRAAVHDIAPDLRVQVLTAPALLTRRFEGPVAVFADWLLADMAGIELARRLRARGSDAPLHLTLVLAADSQDERQRALAAGADDYCPGPLTPALLASRVGALLEDAPLAEPPLALGALQVDPPACAALYQGRALPLRQNELALLSHFLRRPNRVFSRGELIGALGKDGAVADERTVDVWVSRLRRSLARHGVTTLPRTVRALGYVMDAPRF